MVYLTDTHKKIGLQIKQELFPDFPLITKETKSKTEISFVSLTNTKVPSNSVNNDTKLNVLFKCGKITISSSRTIGSLVDMSLSNRINDNKMHPYNMLPTQRELIYDRIPILFL